MDLLTPAKVWAEAPPTPDAPTAPEIPMSVPKRLAMLATVIVPFLGLLGAIWMLWHRGQGWVSIGWAEVIVMLVMYAVAGFGITIGYHRLLTHRAFECPRWLRAMLAVFGSAAGQGMAIRWCATHRRHHQLADMEGDPHSPHLHGHGVWGGLRGLWHAHVGWTFEPDRPGLARSIPDLLADRTLLLIDQLYLLWVALGLIVPGVVLGLWTQSWVGVLSGVTWGGLVRIFLMHHVTWSINSVCHVFGTRPFNSADQSTNNFPIAIVSLGEGWHNNHHAFPTSARHGLKWWQFDASWCLIDLMRRLGLAWNVRLPNAAALAQKRR